MRKTALLPNPSFFSGGRGAPEPSDPQAGTREMRAASRTVGQPRRRDYSFHSPPPVSSRPLWKERRRATEQPPESETIGANEIPVAPRVTALPWRKFLFIHQPA